MREDTRTLLFAAIVCVSCSLLLSGTAALLKGRQDANAAFDVQRNIVKAFGVDIAEATPDSIRSLFDDNIHAYVIDAATGHVVTNKTPDQISADDAAQNIQLPLYIWQEDGPTPKYAFPVYGKGLWSTIYGYLSLDSDAQTVAGITFYNHGETPGLGAEIDKDWFQIQFAGKQLYAADGAPAPLSVVKGDVTKLPPQEQAYSVNGISGATLTGKGVELFLRKDLALYAPYFNRIRGD